MFVIYVIMDEYVLHVGNRHHRHGFKAFLAKVDCLVKGVKRHHEIASEIQDIKTRVCEIRERSKPYSFNTFGGGAEDKTWYLGRESIHGESNRTAISVKVADEQIATGHFDCHACITVSIIQGGGSTKDHDKKLSAGEEYFVVFDDNYGDNKEQERCRVLQNISTCSCSTAFQFDQEKQHPLELKDLSFDIAKKFEGLPLANYVGFVKQQQQQHDATAEDVARQSLTQLINKNLVHVELIDFNGMLILSKSDELNFFFQTSPTQLTNLNQTARHISIQNIGSNNLSSTIRSSKAHSIIFLRELHWIAWLRNCRIGKSVAPEILKCKRYKPKSLSELHKLETLDLKRSPYSDTNFQIRQGVKIHGNVQSLKSIEKLYLVDVDAGKSFDLVSELGKRWDALCNAIEQMSLHQSLQIISAKEEEPLQLQSMTSPLLLYCLRLQARLEKLPHWISDLKCLIPLNILGELPKLLELFLYKGCNGTQVHFESGYIPALKILILEKLDRLNRLAIDENALHLVEHLFIGSCQQLKMLPSDICHIKCLSVFEVSLMSKEFVRRMLPGVDEDHWKVQNIANVHVYIINTEQQYLAYKLGDSTLLDSLN
ncbi:hypothetical protein V6Z12_A10G086600 [Gossypium hirsutum]